MKNLKTEIRIAHVSEIQSLRQLVLWPHKTIDQCVLDSDHDIETFHVASFSGAVRWYINLAKRINRKMELQGSF
ncbi:MAG: hypothetical protein ACKO7C_00040 [Bacteroidota bacterium]